MGFPVGEVQTAFITLYRSDATLQGLLTGAVGPAWNIFDMGAVPTNQPFPYIAVYPVTSTQGKALAFGTDAVDVVMQVSVYTQSFGAGFAQARAIAKQVYALTHEKVLTLASGFTNIGILFENGQELMEPDGRTQQYTQRFRAWVQG